MRRIATYLRSRNPEGPTSAPAQRAFFEAWFAAHPDDAQVHAFEDLDRDADPPFFKRKGALALIAAMKAGEIDAMLITTTDRVTRYREEVPAIRALRQKHGVKLITQHTGEGEDPDALWEQFQEHMIEVFVAWERMVRSDAARRGAATRRANRLARETAATNAR